MNKYSSKLKFLYNFFFLFILILNIKGEEVFITMRKPEITTKYIDKSNKVRIDNEQNSQIFPKLKDRFLINILSIDFEVNITKVDDKIIKKITHHNYNAISIFFDKGENFFINFLILLNYF
jgi:hypothetical protein